MAYSGNQVTIQAGVPASTAGSNDASGTLRIHKNDFKMYNVNVKNTYGVGSQAIAISQYGSRVGLYACGFYGYQDTLYANQGTQVYLRGYIEVSNRSEYSHVPPYPTLTSPSSLGSDGLYLWPIGIRILWRKHNCCEGQRLGYRKRTRIQRWWKLYVSCHQQQFASCAF